MARRRRALSALLGLFLAFSPALLYAAPAALAAPALRQGILDQCDDGSTSKSVLFSSPGNRTDCYLAFDNHASVDRAFVDLTIQGTRSSSRPNPFDRTPDAFPETPYLDVSGNGSREWAFDSSQWGPLGHTTKFSDGSASASVTLGAGAHYDLSFDVPSNAEIINATITMSGDPVPYWAQQYPLTDSNWSEGEEGPYLFGFGGLLWAAWSSGDPSLIKGGLDLDVVVRSYDGANWSAVTDVSEFPGDFEDDREVIMTVYRNELWVIWSHGDDMGTTGQTDLVYSRFNGFAWSAIGHISPDPTDGLNTYESAVVHQGRLWFLWKTTDTSISGGNSGSVKDLDIVVRSYDGAPDAWDTTYELTDPSNVFLDWISDVKSFGGKLYVVWEASYWNLSKVYTFGNFPQHSDILMRVWDGVSWGPAQMMSQQADTDEGVNVEDQSPRLAIYNNPVSGLQELYLIWMRGCLQDNGCTPDYDIAVRTFNGAAWSLTSYITDEADTDQDMFPCMVEFASVFYVFWVSGVNVTQTPAENVILIAAYGDIAYRAYNGREWSEVKEVTPLGFLDNVSHPACAVFNDRLYAAWESPTNYANGSREWDITVRNIDFNKVQVTGVYGGVAENYSAPVNLSFYDTSFPFNLEGLNGLLGDHPVGQDAWGNEMSRIPLDLSTTTPAKVEVTGIDIRYSYSVRVDIRQALSDQIAAEKGDLYATSTVRVPLELGMEGGAGRITINQVEVEYRIDYPPTLIKSLASLKIEEDSGVAPPIDLNLYFTDDWDAGHLRFEMGNATNTQHVYIALQGSQLTIGTLTANWCGVATFTITAYDRNAYFARSNNATVFVECVNDPPELQPIADINISAAQVYSGDVSAYDPDIGDSLSFSSDSEWVTVDPATGAFRIGDKAGTPDRLRFNITVTDLAQASDTKNATLTVWRTTDPIYFVSQPTTVDFPYWLFLLLLGPVVGYIVYRVRTQRLEALEEVREEIQRQKDKEDLKEIDD